MPLWNLFSSLLWDPTLSWLLSPWFLLFCLLSWFFLGSSTNYPGVILEFLPCSLLLILPTPWALHQLVALYTFHTLMTPKCTFQPGPFLNCRLVYPTACSPLSPYLPGFLLPSSFPSFLLPNSFFSLSLSFYPKSHITSVICAHNSCVCVKQPRRAVHHESNSTLYRKVCQSLPWNTALTRGLQKKILIYKPISFMLQCNP